MARVTVLGSAGSFPWAGRACSSYLVEHDGHRVVLDCGNGSMGNLQRVTDVAQIDAVVISHLHPDHFVDLYGLYVALTLHPSGPQSVDVHAPAGAEEHIARLMPDEPFRQHCRFHIASAGSTVGIGPMDITFFAADHPIETLASRIDAGGSVIAYTADTGPSAHVSAAASSADLLLCEASWLEADGPHPCGVHLTGADAGRLAAEARVDHLVLTHLRAWNDTATLASEAARSFDGRITVAEDLHVYEC